MKPLPDILTTLDASEKKGNLVAVSAKLSKTPSALSYIIYKLKGDLNIQLLDRSGHRVKLTHIGRMLLEKRREVLYTVRELEKQAIRLHGDWENRLVTGVGDTFPFSPLTLLIEPFYQHHSVTCLEFINGVLGGSWGVLARGRVDIIADVMHESPATSELGFAQLGVLEQVLVVAPHHPLAWEQEPLDRHTIRRFRVIVVDSSVQHASVSGSRMLDNQETTTAFDFRTRLELQINGLGRGYIPCYLTQRPLGSGSLIEKKMVGQILFEPVRIGWNE